MNLKEQLAQARCCGLEILINVFLKAVSHTAIHPRTREKKIFTARDHTLQVFVCYGNLHLKAAHIYPEQFLCFHIPERLFAIDHSVSIQDKMIVNIECNRQLFFLYGNILSALVIAVVWAVEEAPGNPTQQEHEELCLRKAGTPAGKSCFSPLSPLHPHTFWWVKVTRSCEIQRK